MDQRIRLVTLGVEDLAAARRFFEEGLGWRPSSASSESVAFYQAGSMALSLFPRHELAQDANAPLERHDPRLQCALAGRRGCRL